MPNFNKKAALSSSPVIAAIAIAAAVALHNPSEPFSGKVDAVHQAKVGELLVIEASPADSYKWTVLSSCPSENYYLVDNKLIFSAPEAGEYVFVCAMAKGSKVELITHKIVVDPYSPSIRPLISKWLPSNYDKSVAKRLSAALKEASSKATTVEELISKSAEANRTALADDLEDWKPFLQNMASYCQENLQGKSLAEHVAFWNEVAVALEK
jgi:hypothetical protein